MRLMSLAIGLVLVLVTTGAPGSAVVPKMTRALAQGTPPSGGMTGMDMMGMMGGPFSATAHPTSMDQAVEVLRQWPAAHHLNGLVLDEVEAYTQNFYGQFKERSTGRGAVQILVDWYTGRVMPEMGPNMLEHEVWARHARDDGRYGYDEWRWDDERSIRNATGRNNLGGAS
jgi:hypothetical protein